MEEVVREERDRVGHQGDGEKEEEARTNGVGFHGYGDVEKVEDSETDTQSELPVRSAPQRAASPAESMSTPDDTPSIQGSALSSPGSSVPASQASLARPHHPHALKPFDRRFSSRLSSSPVQSPRTNSPAFLTPRSRQTSLSSVGFQGPEEADTPQAPWEVVRWTKLKKITAQVFSEAGKRNFGRPTCLTVAASIVLGTSKGLILVFDYHQTLKSIIGPGTPAIECGAVTALAISADHTTVAGGHMNGHIFTWELARPAKPFLHISPLERQTIDRRSVDGHVAGSAVVHVGFLGTRHTALVSADDGGMAFSHLATRGLGAVGRTVKTTRILGRYPLLANSNERPRKPSSVLAFSPLPLGNVEQPTDGLGLTALLTPYLLVIVSTTPVAQTQHKSSRPKELAPHSALSGCLAWFPAVKLKKPSAESKEAVSKTKLVYCWSNILTILDVDVEEAEDKDKPPVLQFRPRSRWRAEEAIVAVQWLSRSVLAVLTISQRLLILEDTSSLRMTDTFDLIHKHIFHQDLFFRQLQPVVEQLDEGDVSMHGVVADAFYMSFRAYKGRLFLLGFNDTAVGTLSNWADRLVALMEDGDFIGGITLATSYYNGDADKLTVGLPEDPDARHSLVQERLLEMISASLRYAFSGNENGHSNHPSEKLLADLATASFTACMSMQEVDFLFETVYERYEEASMEGVFFDALEPYILDEEITAIPPDVLKDLVTHYAAQGKASKLEEMICRLNTQTLDIDQTTTLCRQYKLYDALIYVWNQALDDYITPLIELLNIVKVLQHDGQNDNAVELEYLGSAQKIFPYLAFVLTGRIYPSDGPIPDEQARKAKSDLYGFLFSGKVVEWPPGSRNIFHASTTNSSEPAFPYLHLIIRFDTGSLMSVLNEAFEDSFLNGNPQSPSVNGAASRARPSSSQGLGLVPTRQYIVSILLDLVSSERFDPEDSIYVYMFVARNLPKFPQFIILPGSSLHRVLEGLCQYPSEEVADDCQLSVEYLLSVYHPPDTMALVDLFQKAKFFRVLKSVYRGARQYAKLLQAHFDDVENRADVFACIGDCLRPNRGLTKKQVAEVEAIIVSHASDLADIDTVRTAQTIKAYAPQLLKSVLEGIEDSSYAQYIFLQTLIEPQSKHQFTRVDETVGPQFVERYVQLMCKFDSSRVADFIGFLKSGDLRLDRVLPAMESSGVIDAAVVLMARDGLVREAMDRLLKHLGTLETALTGLINAAVESPDVANTEEAVDDLLDGVQKYSKVGIWLCQGQTRTMERPKTQQRKIAHDMNTDPEKGLAMDERLWLDLLDQVVSMTRAVGVAAAHLEAHQPASASSSIDTERITSALRTAVQQAFTALLAATSAPKAKPAAPSASPARPPTASAPTTTASNPSFLVILRAFLARAARSSPTLSDLRSVLTSIFAAYAHESTILSLAARFLDNDLFARVEEAYALRQRGWRPRGNACEGCGRRVWGPGAGGEIWEAWERRSRREERARRKRFAGAERDRMVGGGAGGAAGNGAEEGGQGGRAGRMALGPLLVFACRHLWHRTCLEQALFEKDKARGHAEGSPAGEPTCPLE
ncbi:Golgi CORVET complex core vacuolar protein 8-domain-containing protein [Lineolata rhizophorae]|uniref:Golgi CORVET complex core vacuolar protein 8-domain-containing protein n=1 Tax=Lineolata rhizophorae TaxID=578093 RepID=A0A6A6P8J5_9PEZI|nr:Golgi CORVET complex core vacuolar protein 8-domain-containing protein [Lineolata rhizophorae]